MILKVLGPEISIGTANTVANSNLVRVINTGAAAVLNIGSVGNVTETLTGTGMVAAPIAFRY